MYWWVGPDSLPLDLKDRLMEHGLDPAGEPAGMAADLTKLNEEVNTPNRFSIKKVTDKDMLKKWTHAALTGFDIQDTIEEAFFAIESFHESIHYYIGLLNNEPVASSLMYLGAGTAGIYWVGTVPEKRRMGLGTAMTLRPLLEARDMGCRIAVLQASPMGYGIYKRIWFKEYCQFTRLIWRG